MNLKLNQIPSDLPPLNPSYIIASIPSPPALLLYPNSAKQQKQQQTKKKFTFKANPAPASLSEDLFVYDLTSSLWKKQTTKGKFPSKRQKSLTTYHCGCIIVYGGQSSQQNKLLNDIFCLNTQTWQWKKLFTMQAPTPMQNFSFFSISKQKIVLINSDIWIFNTKQINWLAQSTDLPGGVWQKLQKVKFPFQIKGGCLQKEKIIIFGQKQLLEIVELDVSAQAIIPLRVIGEKVTPITSIKAINTTQGSGLLINKNIFASFYIEKDRATIEHVVKKQNMTFQEVISFSDEQRLNIGINSELQIYSIELELQALSIESQVQENLPNTMRQLSSSSLVQRQNFSRSEIQLQNPYQEEEPNIVQFLPQLLSKQWIRRRILQQKCSLLQQQIKKTQKMVLTLCRYGYQNQKRAHITKVCKHRQNLFNIFKRQTLYRREINERDGQKQLLEETIKYKKNSNQGFKDIYY